MFKAPILDVDEHLKKLIEHHYKMLTSFEQLKPLLRENFVAAQFSETLDQAHLELKQVVKALKKQDYDKFMFEAKLNADSEDEATLFEDLSTFEKAEEDSAELFQSIIEQNEIQKYSSDEQSLEAFKEWSYIIPVDCDLRTTIPSTADIKIKPSVIWKMLKDMIGKDLSKFTLPVFINEPCSLLMKGAEYGYYTDLIVKAGHEQNSMRRMVLVVATLISVFN